MGGESTFLRQPRERDPARKWDRLSLHWFAWLNSHPLLRLLEHQNNWSSGFRDRYPVGLRFRACGRSPNRS